ncbi:hypothetical protein LXL04_009110 [Taraxacum kok-saghyz]
METGNGSSTLSLSAPHHHSEGCLSVSTANGRGAMLVQMRTIIEIENGGTNMDGTRPKTRKESVKYERKILNADGLGKTRTSLSERGRIGQNAEGINQLMARSYESEFVYACINGIRLDNAKKILDQVINIDLILNLKCTEDLFPATYKVLTAILKFIKKNVKEEAKYNVANQI